MNFARPSFLFALLIAALPAAMYLSRYVRSTRMVFPAATFMFGQDRKELVRLRLRQLVATLVRMSLVVALALGFAGPSSSDAKMGSSTPAPERLALVLDVSASMAATGPEGTLLSEARKLAARRVDEAAANTRFAVVTCPGHQGDLLWLDQDAAALVVSQAKQGWGECRPEEALAHLGPRIERPARLVLLLDTGSARPGGETLDRRIDGLSVETIEIEATPDNLALAGLEARNGAITAVVHNLGQRDTTASIVVECGDHSVAKEVSANARGTVAWTVPLTDGFPAGDCSVTIGPDRFEPDNKAWFELRHRDKTNVLVVEGSPTSSMASSPSFFIGSALRSTGRRVEVVRLTQPELSFASLALADILVLVDPQPMQPYLERDLRRFVHNGGRLWLFAGDNLTAWKETNLLLPGARIRPCVTVADHPFRLTWMDRDAEILATFRELPDSLLASWTHLRHVAVSTAASETRVLARFSDSAPALMEIPIGRGKLVLWAVVPYQDNGNLPFHPLFPLLAGAFLDGLVPPAAVVRVPPGCESGRKCRMSEPGLQRSYRGGGQDSVRVVSSTTGDVVCNQPGPYFETGKKGKRLAFQCRVDPAERTFGEPVVTAAAASSIPTTDDQPPPRRKRHSSMVLASVLLLIVLELWLVTGRRVGG